MAKSSSVRRVRSLDAFRGITVFVMVFVNELAGMRGLPRWMKHMPPSIDGMTFVDVVFPAFLFIAGMSIPLSLRARSAKIGNGVAFQASILWRGIGLLTLGFFEVNIDSQGLHTSMAVPLQLWALAFYAAAILVWNAYRHVSPRVTWTLRVAGTIILLILPFLYRGGEAGDEYVRPHWWGILGLIGWAYLASAFLFQLFDENPGWLIAFGGLAIVYYGLVLHFDWDNYVAKQGIHVMIMLSGAIATVFLFGRKDRRFVQSTGERSKARSGAAAHAVHPPAAPRGVVLESVASATDAEPSEPRSVGDPADLRKRLLKIFAYGIGCAILGAILRPYWYISKNEASPSWALFSVAISCVLFVALYWLVDLKGVRRWTDFFQPAATGALLTYLLPDIIYMITSYFHVQLIPNAWAAGFRAVIACLLFSCVVMFIAKGLEKLDIRLQL